MSKRRKLLFSLVTVCAFFGLLEVALAVFGPRQAAHQDDPYVGFSSYSPLFEEVSLESGETVLQTRPSKLTWFNDQRFLTPKPKNTQRVFCMGGSTTYGRPYDDSTSYSRWVRELLPQIDPAHNWEVINCGGISFASYRVANLMRELSEYEPDLFIVYSVHNEFLERRTYHGMFQQSTWTRDAIALLQRTHTGRMLRRIVGNRAPEKRTTLPAEVDEILNHTVGPVDYKRDDDWRANVLSHYQENLLRMVQIANDCGAKIIFVTAASNERDCTPFKSVWSITEAEQRDQFEREIAQYAESNSQPGDNESLDRLIEIARIDPRCAKTQFQLGQSLANAKDCKRQLTAFRKAINEDVCPLRAPDEINAAIRRVAQETQTVVVEFEQLLREVARDDTGCDALGREYFLDHVHPNLTVHEWLGRWIVESLIENKIVLGNSPDDQTLAEIRDRIQQEIDPRLHGVSLRNLAKVLHWAGKFDEAKPCAQDALELIPFDAESLRVLADCQVNLREIGEAANSYQTLLDHHPLHLPAYLGYAELLMDLGQFERAYPLTASLLEYYPPLSVKELRTTFAHGVCCVETARYEDAIPALEHTLHSHPDDTLARVYLAKAQAGLGDRVKALRSFQSATKANPSDPWAKQQLAMFLIKSKDYQAAIEQLEQALRIDPENQEAKAQLMIANRLLESDSRQDSP